MGQLEEEHQGWASQGYRYDPMGQLSAMLLPDGQVVDYAFSNGRVQQVNLNGQMLTSHHYQANGLEVNRQQGELISQYVYDDMGRLLEHSSHQQKQLMLRRRYEYSQAGNLLKIDDVQRGETQYEYDPLDRLTSVRGVINEHFMHDPAGNLLLNRQANVVGNQLLFQGDKHYQYDEFGNLIRESRGKEGKRVTHYEYDTQHRLKKVTKPDGTVATYQYDAFGRRIEKQVMDKVGETVKTEFLWQGQKLLAESSEEHYQTYLYEYGSFRPLALISGEGAENAQAYFYHLDQLGTPQEITDSEGALAWAVDYHAYGNVARERVKVVNSPLRFQGQYYDEETGLHYNRHRYYSPETGRFITVDPIGLAGGLNNYQYVKNPTGWVDPLGLSQEDSLCPLSNGRREYGDQLKERSAQRVEELKKALSKKKQKQVVATSRAGIYGKYETTDFENFKSALSQTDVPDSVIKVNNGDFIQIPDADKYVDDYLSTLYEDAGTPLHSVTADWIKTHLQANNGGLFPVKNNGLPGTHAEVRSMNDINHYLTKEGIDHDSFDYSSVDVATYKVSPDPHGGQGNPFGACLHCSGIIPKAVNVVTGRRH